MVQIKIKGLNDAYHLYATYDKSEEFFMMLEERLEACAQHSGCFEAFFHLPAMSEQEVVSLFQICEKCHTKVLGINEADEVKKFDVFEENLHNGEHYHFQNHTILLGNVHRLAFVECEESLYVMGCVHGSVDMLHDDCVICASSIHANVRIGDSAFQNVTYFAPCKVYYRQRKIEIQKYKEELQWEKL